jgi:MFS family permease
MFPTYGWLSDRIGRRPLMIAGFLLTPLYVMFAYFQALQSGNLFFITVGLAIPIGFLMSLPLATEASFYAELFPDARYRFSGAALGRQLGTACGGGVLPLVATALLAATPGNLNSVILYFTMICAMALVAMVLAPETNRRKV